MIPRAKNQQKRSSSNECPENDSFHEGANFGFAESIHGQSSSNEVRRDSQADDAKTFEDRIGDLESVSIGVGDCREAKE